MAAPRRPCTYPGCAALVESGRCEQHGYGQDRAKTAERGYDGAWRAFMEWFKRRHPVCADCELAPTTDGHHILKVKDHPELRLVEANVRGLCHGCHAARTARGE